MVVSRSKLMRVFSAHAEVVPCAATAAGITGGILRARGGSSAETMELVSKRAYSPRTRR